MVFKKGSEHKGCIYVLLNTELKGQSVVFSSNGVVEAAELLDKKQIKIREDMVASEDGMIGKLLYEMEVAPTPLSVRVKSG